MTHRKRRFLLASAFASAFAGMTMIVVATVFVGSRRRRASTPWSTRPLDEGASVVVRGPNGGRTAGGGHVAGERRGLHLKRGGGEEITGLSGTDFTMVFA